MLKRLSLYDMKPDDMVNLLFFILLLGAAHAVPKTTCRHGGRYVDLSYDFDKSAIIGWGENRPFKMIVTENGTSEFGIWVQSEEIELGTHVGTHIDAPCHGSRGRWTIDQIPLDHLFAPAAVVDITQRVNLDGDALLLAEDLQRWEMTTGRTLDQTVVLVRTGWGSRWPDRVAYTGNDNNDIDNLHFPGVSEEAAQWLVQNRLIYGLGIESLSLDSGRNIRLRTLPAHKNLLRANIYGLENVGNGNLDKLPPWGAFLSILPMKLKNACGAPVRIVARLPSSYE